MSDKPEVRLPNGRFGPGNKTGGRKRRADENEMLALFDRAMPNGKKIAIVQKQVEKALRGDLDAAKWIFAYYYGTPIQRNEHTGANGEPLGIELMSPSEIIDTVKALMATHDPEHVDIAES